MSPETVSTSRREAFEVNMSEEEAGHFEKAKSHAGEANSLILVFSDLLGAVDFNFWLLAPGWEPVPADCPTVHPNPTL